MSVNHVLLPYCHAPLPISTAESVTYLLNISTESETESSSPNAAECFRQLIQTAEFIPAFVRQPTTGWIHVLVLKTDAARQEKHEILLTEVTC